MTPRRSGRPAAVSSILLVVAVLAGGCGWRGVNSLPLPGTGGGGPGAYQVTAQLPDVTNLQRNSRVRLGDVTVGNVVDIQRQGWHALITMRLDGSVDLPANATAKIGQTSLLGSLHVELGPPVDAPPQGRLRDGSLIPIGATGSYPTTEQTLGTLSLLLNGGGLGQLQEITTAFTGALSGREQDVRDFLGQIDRFVATLDRQADDIVAASESLNRLVAQFAAGKPVVDRALATIPEALRLLADRSGQLTDVLERLGEFSALAADSVDQTKTALVAELHALGPVLTSLGDTGPALTRALGVLLTFPWPKDTLENWMRGDYANSTFIVDLTLSRLDSALFTGTRFEGALTELEMQWGRTIGQKPSPYTHGNPLIAPYRTDQGP
ncbi:MCE family protein [Mycobacterium manitobense]|uniref:MCE family protein n=1 Tax=[Mycobacterium] manitobense TaxID=190147 RepID=A0A9X2YM00_9MYCO|nr:MCE family protein [[Mycobacterium] manitobense]MCV7169594.1 MCE family protein [[Mycobacterium] manitobense]